MSKGNPIAIQVDQFGEGSPPAIFVHGSGRAGAAAWPAQSGLSGRRLLFVHLRGFGVADDTTGFDYETDTNDLLDLLQEAEPSHLVGASYGGVSALMATMRAEGRVASLTLVEPILLSIARGDVAVEALVAKTQHALEARSLEEFEGRLEQAIGLKMKKPWMEEDRRWLERFKAQRPPWDASIPSVRLPDMEVPLLVVTGGWNKVYEAIARRLVDGFGAHHEVIEGAGHRPQDHPRFNPILGDWWARAEQTAR
jgi:pimeloyl-ACP methyl ester carboxylesterase